MHWEHGGNTLRTWWEHNENTKNEIRACTGPIRKRHIHKSAFGLMKQGVCQTTVAMPFALKFVLRQKKSYGKLKYFTMQEYI